MRDRRPSLRRNLLVLLVGATGIVWLAVAAATFVDARHRADQLFDTQLQEYSEVLSAIGGHELLEMEEAVTSFEHAEGPTLAYQVYDAQGRARMASHAAPAQPLADRDGFQDVEREGTRWRAYRRTDATHGLLIIVAHDRVGRESMVRNIALSLVAPLLFGLPVLGGALWIAVSRSLAPLDSLAAEVARRKPDQLEPIEDGRVPREVLPLARALNHLFVRLGQSFANERRFTGDAAHELRTPLAALKTQAQLALSASAEERRRRALEQVVTGVDRAARLVEQLLALARLDASMPPAGDAVDLAGIARETAGDLADEARRRSISVTIVPSAPAPAVQGEREMLRLLARNLLDNAVRYTPSGGRVRVSIEPAGDEVLLKVEDSGPGVAPAQRERIFDRFYRVGGEAAPGSGLGLAIARAVVELHGGAIRAEESEALRGLAVIATLPAAHKDSLRNAA